MYSSYFGVDLLKLRRLKVLDLMSPNSLAVFPATTRVLRNLDVEFKFRQDSNFSYLTQIFEPDHVLVLFKSANNYSEEILFLSFPNEEEMVWVGASIDEEQAKLLSGIDKICDIKELPSYLKSYSGVSTVYFEKKLGHLYPCCIDLVVEVFRDKIISPLELMSNLRLVKNDLEIQLIKQACQINRYVFEQISSLLEDYPSKASSLTTYKLRRDHRQQLKESDIEAFILYVYAQNEADWSFWPIVASGGNATILHYTKNNAEILAGNLLLVDSGCELKGYASDITRTFEVGQVSEFKRLILTTVEQTQQQVINFLKQSWFNQTRISLIDLQEYTVNLVCQVLLDLGIFPNHSWEEIREKQLYKKYYPHKVAHFLGLDVHDLRSDYTLRMPLVKNMVLTIEPGLYFPVDDLQIPEEFRGVGVRIEDDLLITESGIEILT